MSQVCRITWRDWTLKRPVQTFLPAARLSSRSMRTRQRPVVSGTPRTDKGGRHTKPAPSWVCLLWCSQPMRQGASSPFSGKGAKPGKIKPAALQSRSWETEGVGLSDSKILLFTTVHLAFFPLLCPSTHEKVKIRQPGGGNLQEPVDRFWLQEDLEQGGISFQNAPQSKAF